MAHISQQKKRAALKRRAEILRYMLDNPGVKQVQIADKFHMSPAAVSVHVKKIRKGWRPPGWVDQNRIKKPSDNGGEDA